MPNADVIGATTGKENPLSAEAVAERAPDRFLVAFLFLGVDELLFLAFSTRLCAVLGPLSRARCSALRRAPSAASARRSAILAARSAAAFRAARSAAALRAAAALAWAIRIAIRSSTASRSWVRRTYCAL